MIELLAPAGSMEALKAAVQNGANAVYLGCGSFNARQSAKNFTIATLNEAVKYCHVRGVQVHLTLNIAGVSLLDAGRAETRNLAAVLVGLEHLVSLEHFINRAVHDFQRMLAQRTGRRVHDRGKHLQHRIRRMFAAEAAGKVVQIRIQHRVAGTGGYGERGMCFRPAVDITRC